MYESSVSMSTGIEEVRGAFVLACSVVNTYTDNGFFQYNIPCKSTSCFVHQP